jgi:hypothetical protein
MHIEGQLMSPARKRKGDSMMPRRKTSFVVPDDLWIKLKVAAAEERTDVSALLCKLAEDYLRSRKGGRR